MNILFDKEQVSENTRIYIPWKRYKIMRLQEPQNWYPGNAPENTTSIICEIACNYGDATWNIEWILLKYFNQLLNLILCGRQALYRDNNMDHSLEKGLNAADVILKNSNNEKIYEIANERVYLETGHVMRESENSILQE